MGPVRSSLLLASTPVVLGAGDSPVEVTNMAAYSSLALFLKNRANTCDVERSSVCLRINSF